MVKLHKEWFCWESKWRNNSITSVVIKAFLVCLHTDVPNTGPWLYTTLSISYKCKWRFCLWMEFYTMHGMCLQFVWEAAPRYTSSRSFGSVAPRKRPCADHNPCWSTTSWQNEPLWMCWPSANTSSGIKYNISRVKVELHGTCSYQWMEVKVLLKVSTWIIIRSFVMPDSEKILDNLPMTYSLGAEVITICNFLQSPSQRNRWSDEAYCITIFP